jgi:hypothetical protein
MTVSDDRFVEMLGRLKSNLFAAPEKIKLIEDRLSKKEIDATRATQELMKLERDIEAGPLGISDAQVEDEWSALSNTISEAEHSAQKQALHQYWLGVATLPTVMGCALLSLVSSWPQASSATAIAAIISACLAAAAAHSFLLLRVYQQASLAAERLVEKRVGILYMRLAARSKEKDESKKLLEAGTKMFIGHQAPATIPLNASDFARAGVKVRTEK